MIAMFCALTEDKMIEVYFGLRIDKIYDDCLEMCLRRRKYIEGART